MKNRMKNPWFWVGLVGVILTATGVNPTMFTSWGVLKDSIIQLINNPYLLGTTACAILGIFVDPTTKGITDKK